MPSPNGGHPIASVPTTGNPEVDAFLWDYRWAESPGQPVALTFSFATSGSVWSNVQGAGYGPVLADTAEPWSSRYAGIADADKPAIRSAVQAWANVANVAVSEVADDSNLVGDIRFAYTGYLMSGNDAGYTWLPSSGPKAGDVWLNPASPVTHNLEVSASSQGFNVVLHEIGHALGLLHPSEDPSFPVAYASRAWSVMNYAHSVTYPGAFPDAFPTTPMSLDIQAMQYIYGPNLSHHAGDDVYEFSQGARYYQTIWDAGGNDTIRWNGTTQGVLLDLTPGAWSTLGQPITYRLGGTVVEIRVETVQIYKSVLIENGVGGEATDTIVGNAANNGIWGRGGADNLSGRDGNDTILGGAGDDLVHGEAGDDTIVGEDGVDVIYGGDGQDALDGRAGIDVIYGETGVDIIFGDADSDTLYGGDQGDVMMGERGEPSAVGASDALYGEAGNDLLDGSAGGDWIYGGEGNDVIDGDEGSDYIVGGPGIEYMLGSAASAYGPETTGQDLFVYQSLVDAGDEIWGFDTRAGTNDGIDLRPLFDALGYSGTTPRADGWMTVTTGAVPTDSMVWIDPNGGGDGFIIPLLTLHGVAPAMLTDSFFLFQ